MDNLIVGLTGLFCFAVAEMSTSWIESVTPLGVIALVVYYFLWKFDRQLETLKDDTSDIKDKVNRLAEKKEE